MSRVLPVRLAEVFTALVLAALTHLGLHAPRPAAEPCRFTLAVVGEREHEGLWQGVDLLTAPKVPVERFQVALTPSVPLQAFLDVVGPEGTTRLFPTAGQTGLLRAGVAYALPGPRTFYGVEGEAHLRLTVLRPGLSTDGMLVPARPERSATSTARVRLSDGQAFEAEERAFEAPEPAQVEWTVRGLP